MLLIFGLRPRYRVLSEGTFACPNEGGDRTYRRKLARNWFTLFFVPLIPLNVLGEMVECSSCKTAYDPKVLTMPTAAQMMNDLADAVRHAVVAVMVADGDADEAEKRAGLALVETYADTPYTMYDLESDLRSLRRADVAGTVGRVAGSLNEHGKEGLMMALGGVATSDGGLHGDEVEALRDIGASLGLTPAHIRGILADVTDGMFES